MSDLNAFADRFEIEALRSEFVDALATRDDERVASLFTDDGAWRDLDAQLVGRDEIRDGIAVRPAYLGSIELDGDTAVGRAFVTDGGGYAAFDDSYRRTPDGWKFAGRSLAA